MEDLVMLLILFIVLQTAGWIGVAALIHFTMQGDRLKEKD